MHNRLFPPLEKLVARKSDTLEQLRDSLVEIRHSASGENMLVGGGPGYGFKFIRSVTPIAYFA